MRSDVRTWKDPFGLESPEAIGEAADRRGLAAFNYREG